MIRPVSRETTCGRVHLGPAVDDFDAAGRKAGQTCLTCMRALTADERLRYWKVRVRIAELQVVALRAAWRPPA